MCDAKIRPFPNPTEIQCGRDVGFHSDHRGMLRDYAFPGSVSEITWQESDRRTYRGEWAPCDGAHCSLPLGHRGDHA